MRSHLVYRRYAIVDESKRSSGWWPPGRASGCSSRYSLTP